MIFLYKVAITVEQSHFYFSFSVGKMLNKSALERVDVTVRNASAVILCQTTSVLL